MKSNAPMIPTHVPQQAGHVISFSATQPHSLNLFLGDSIKGLYIRLYVNPTHPKINTINSTIYT